MTLLATPAYVGSMEHPPELDRNLLQGIFARTGALRYGDFALSVGTGTRGIAIAGGQYFLKGAETDDQGGYVCTSTATPDNVNLDAASGNPYIATIILRVRDDQYSTPGDPAGAAIEVFNGVAAASPTALPDSTWNTGGAEYAAGAWARLGDVRVNPGDTAIPGGQITSAERYTKTAAGILIARSTDTIAEARLGDMRYDVDTGLYSSYDGSSWGGIPDGRTFCKVQMTDLHLTNTTKVDSNLVFPARAGKVYSGLYTLMYWGHASNDMEIDFTLPAGASINPFSVSVRSISGTASSNFEAWYKGVKTNPTDFTLGTLGVTTNDVVVAQVDVIFVMGGTPGNVILRASKKTNTNAATDGVLGESSKMLVTEAG